MEIELYSKIQNPVEAIKSIGEFFAKSGMFGCEKVEQGQVLAMECLTMRKPPSVIARTYHIMDGKLSKKALAALAEFRGIGGKHRWIEDGTDGKRAIIELSLDGNTITSKFTIDEAKAQGLIRPKSNWEKTPANMLRARAISNGVAMLAPEIYAGDVEDDESAATASPEPLLKPQASVSSPAPQSAHTTSPEPKREKVIDISAEQVKPAEPQSEAKTFTEADIAIDSGTQRLTVNAMAALEFAIEDMPKAIAFMKSRNWIESSLSELSEENGKRIMRGKGDFNRYVKQFNPHQAQ